MRGEEPTTPETQEDDLNDPMAASNNQKVNVASYLERIGFDGEIRQDLRTLEALQRAHLSTVPFENLHVYHRLGVRTDTAWSLAKIVDEGRGGWCFEVNGAFSALLMALDFDVVRLGATVLLGGESKTIDHLTIEVALGEPYLVDVGFGNSFIKPLKLEHSGPQDGGTGVFEIIHGPRGATLTQVETAKPSELYRFDRIGVQMSDFDAASQRLQSDRNLQWSLHPFATRLLDGGPDRVTLLEDTLKLIRRDQLTETPVAAEAWESTLIEWFTMPSPHLGREDAEG